MSASTPTKRAGPSRSSLAAVALPSTHPTVLSGSRNRYSARKGAAVWTSRCHSETTRARSIASGRHEAAEAARRWVQLTAQRKDLLYRAHERQRVAARIVEDVFADGEPHRIILFHERVDEAVQLFEELLAEHGRGDLDPGMVDPIRVELEHSKLSDKRRRAALASFAGLARRFDIVGTSPSGITVIDDFGHNPDKVSATLATLKAHPGRVIAFFQPHGYGPLRQMGHELAQVFAQKLSADDLTVLCDPVYFGGTVDRSQGSERIVGLIRVAGGSAEHVPERAACADRLVAVAKPGDRVVIVGDTPADLQCGRGVGARAIGVATGHYTVEDLAAHDPAAVFPDLRDTAAVMDAIDHA